MRSLAAVRPLVMAAAIAAFAAPAALAQEPPADTASTTAAAATAQEDDPDLDPNRAQPDFALAALPTNLRLPRHKVAFRVTHRFGRALGDGDFGDLASDLFGLDSGGVIGLEVRYGLFRGGQIGIHRTSDRTIQLFGQYNAIRDGNGPLGVSLLVSVEGMENLSEEHSPGVAVLLSRELGDRGAIYLQPAYVGNTNFATTGDDYTVMAGIGARLRVSNAVYVVLETAPRFAGFTPFAHHASFGIERRQGGHLFQLNFSNGLGSTLAQIARGGTSNSDWYIGFNISRKFY